MKKPLFLVAVFLIMPFCKSQEIQDIELQKSSKYEYDRTVDINPEDSTQLIIIFTFQNKENQIAITYRQEYENSMITWVETGKAMVKKENIVESLIDNLAPGEQVQYKYVISNEKKIKSKIELEKAALLIMNENFDVEKVIFEPETITIEILDLE